MKIRNAAILAILSLGLAVSACKKKEDSAFEEAADAVGDATDTRDHENMKDAGEDMKDAAGNVKDEVEDATN